MSEDAAPRSQHGRPTVIRSLIFPIYCVILLELLARALVAIAGIQLDSSYGYPSDLFVDHTTRGYAYAPGFKGFFPNEPFSDIPISINSHGFRDIEFQNSSHSLNVLVLGDSITFGAGVKASQRYTDRLREMVCSGSGCEIMNLGVNGYQIQNYHVVLREEIGRLKPTIVILGFCMNDLQPAASIDQLQEARRVGLMAKARYVLSFSTALRLASRATHSLTWDAEEYKNRWIQRALDSWSKPERITA
ncbi:MAG: SGNH/GDSL hydrolase family protein, partial [bacterium]